MRNGVMSIAYKRDVKKMRKQQRPLDRLGDAVQLLIYGAPLPPEFLDHPLKGDWKGKRELHIAPDWLLIYHVENDTVYLDRTGSHSDLFSQPSRFDEMKPELAKKMETQKRRPSTPGDVLADLLETVGISQSEFARHIGVSGATVNRLIMGHQALTPDMAQQLGRYWGDGARVWLTLQQMVDQWDMAHADKKSYEFIIPQQHRIAA